MQDYQDTNDNDTLYKTIGIGLAALVGYGIYKQGWTKDIAAGLLKLGDTVGKQGGDRAAIVMSSIKEWANNPGKQVGSIFRREGDSFFYSLYKDIGDLSSSNLSNFRRVKDIMASSKKDLNDLFDKIQNNLTNIQIVQRDYRNTELMRIMQDIKNAERITRTDPKSNSTEAELFNSKMFQDFMDFVSQKSEVAAQELRESGYRKLTLGDILEVYQDRDGLNKLRTKAGSVVDIGHQTSVEHNSLLEEVQNFLQNSYHSYHNADGKIVTALGSGDWKNIIIDPAMRISEKGEIIDYRMGRDTLHSFFHSLSTDFKLPVVQFNPFKVMSTMGIDFTDRFETFASHKTFTAMISADQFDPNITKLAGTQKNIGEWLGDTFGEAFRGSNLAVINGKAYAAGKNKELVEVASNLKLFNLGTPKEPKFLHPRLNAFRQMSGLNIGSPLKQSIEDYEQQLGRKLTQSERVKYQAALWLDMGFQEPVMKAQEEATRFDTATSIDEIMNDAIDRMTRKIRVNGFEYKDVKTMQEAAIQHNYNTVFGAGFTPYKIINPLTNEAKEITPNKFTTLTEGFKLGNIARDIANKDFNSAKIEAEGFVKQFFGGRYGEEISQWTTERTSWSWSLINNLAQPLSSSIYFLGLSPEVKGNALQYGSNLLLKRALPAYMLTKVPGMINYLSEPFFGSEDENGNRDNITKWLVRDVVKPIDIQSHHAMDLFGVNEGLKYLGQFIPGTDQITELPFIHSLGLGQTAKERKEYIENGYDPIRKGRWWGSGNTPYTGGKIMYYRPNLYRRIEADVDFSDSKWGSRQEYYENAWFPNIVNPFAPLNHFIFDRNHYDKKHYHDRPYLQTAPEGSTIPIIGPAFGATIGKVINPPQRMHKEYWKNPTQVNPDDENLDIDFKYTRNVFNDIWQKQTINQQSYTNRLSSASSQAKTITSRTIYDNAGIRFTERIILPHKQGTVQIQQASQQSSSYFHMDSPVPVPTEYMTGDGMQLDTNYEAYSTPSGAMRIVDIPDNLNLYDVNQDLKRYSVNKIIGTNQRISINNLNGYGIPQGNDNKDIDNKFIFDMGEQYHWIADVAGLRGFAVQQFITGHPNQSGRVIEDSGNVYSFNRDFWDENLGGLGGNLSEIVRRFMPKRNDKVEYVNPIRNTMPTWMPGSNYFTDFKHGDPYSKIENGEERLPGQGYERLYHIDNPLKFNINVSDIGKNAEELIPTMLHRGSYQSSYSQDQLKSNRNLKKDTIRAWREDNLIIKSDYDIDDKRHNITGSIDAIVHDEGSPTGVGIVSIEAVPDKLFRKLKKSGMPLQQHREQVNYQIWASGFTQNRGYVYYINQDNPDKALTTNVYYNEQLLQQTFSNIHNARQGLRQAVENGTIGRGEMYSTLDRFRILADVAPYSQEFKDTSAQLSMEKLTDEQKKEVSAIRDRVTAQKEPLRVYPYKFKTANLKTETVTVDKIIDNNTFITREYGKEHAVKFAGITVTESSEPIEKKHYERKRRKGLEKVAHNIRKKVEESPSYKDKAAHEIHKYIRKGAKIQISYDVDEHNKYSTDTTRSIRAVVTSRGTNVNHALLESGYAKEKENDNSPAGIRARYTNGEIRFGSAMETLTHSIIGNIPIVGSKIFQVQSPYEQYRKREVYSKDFQSWNHPVRDILVPHIENTIGDAGQKQLLGVVTGAFVGTLFGTNPFGKMVGGFIGGAIPLVGAGIFHLKSDEERDWRPKRRVEQEAVNEYVDTLKYVKNMKLYNEYATKSKVEDHFDVERFMQSKESQGIYNKLRTQELNEYKKRVKLDFKHRKSFEFKYGQPKYVESKMGYDETIKAINQELKEIQGDRSVVKIPTNALKAISFKQAADQTMYGYNPGDSMVNIMSALPKKDRQYFKHFIDAPEEEKQKILRIAPSYLRRALQSTWGMHVDEKPTLKDYFSHHALPGPDWVGWDENTSMDDVKVKIVHNNKLDPGEFDIWPDNQVQADQSNIPIPRLHKESNPREVQLRLQQVLGKAGIDNVQGRFVNSSTGNQTHLDIYYDDRDNIADQISEMTV